MDRRKVHTYDTTTFTRWFELAAKAFADRGLREPRFGEARDAYEVGESPETWVDYVRFNEGMKEVQS